jgi:hypothetical protein
MQKPYGATLKYFFIIILWLLNTEITRGHSWSLVVIRGHSWSLVVTRGHSCVLLDKIVHIHVINHSFFNKCRTNYIIIADSFI